MKKFVVYFGLFCLGLFLARAAGAPNLALLSQNALNLEKSADYQAAIKSYQEAEQQYRQQGDKQAAQACRTRIRLLNNILAEYPYKRGEALKIMQKIFPEMSESERENWLKQADSLTIDGQTRYFARFEANLMSRNPKLLQLSAERVEAYRGFYRKYLNFIAPHQNADYSQERSQAYVSPITYQGTAQVDIPRKELPEKGTFRVWFPVPVETAGQRDVRVYEIAPARFAPFPPQIDREIGAAYFEVPLSELKDDLKLSVKFIFTHYAQRFLIDPKQVGEYDRNSLEYRRFTASRDNCSYTPEMKNKALQVVGGEKNPYLQAKALYDYIVKNIAYSFMPHASLSALKQPESVYVFKNGYGDCGAQSTYFAALCRSLGIPARITGGFQLCPDHDGPHFWAEFYLPNYGWIPVDTSVAQIADYLPDLSKAEVDRYHQYFFGSQDPYRYVIQTQGDARLLPPPREELDLELAVQFPVAECAEMKDNPNDLLQKYLKMDFTPLERN